jgi:hypothetical protein
MALLSGKQILAACSTIMLALTICVSFLPREEAMGHSIGQGGTPLAATVLEWGMVPFLPGEFLQSHSSWGRSLLRVKVKLKGLSHGVHPGYFLMDRINGETSRVVRLEEGGGGSDFLSSGELWDYKVFGQPDSLSLPHRGTCILEMRFVVPLGFKMGVLDYRGRSLARIGP